MNMNIYILIIILIYYHFLYIMQIFVSKKENKRMERKGKEKQNRISRKNVFLYNVYD